MRIGIVVFSFVMVMDPIRHSSGIIFLYAHSQWGTMLRCNVISHWLDTFTKWSLRPTLGVQSRRWHTFENIHILSKVNIWNVNCAWATALIFDTRTGVLVKMSKFLRQKMSWPKGDLNPQPSDSTSTKPKQNTTISPIQYIHGIVVHCFVVFMDPHTLSNETCPLYCCALFCCVHGSSHYIQWDISTVVLCFALLRSWILTLYPVRHAHCIVVHCFVVFMDPHTLSNETRPLYCCVLLCCGYGFHQRNM